MTDNDSSGVSEAETRRSGGASTSGELEDVEDSRSVSGATSPPNATGRPEAGPRPCRATSIREYAKTLSGHIWHAPSRRSTAFVSSFF